MKPKKMSLANIQGKMSRAEMKKIMAGSGEGHWCSIDSDCPPLYYTCSGSNEIHQSQQGVCRWTTMPPHCVYGFVC